MKQGNLSGYFKRKINDDGVEGSSTSAVGSDSSLEPNTTNKHFKTMKQVHPADIGHFLHGAVSDKINTIKTVWTPPPSYTFPLLDKFKDKKIKLRFQHKWLTEFNWLSYSAKENAAFCKYYVLFATTGGIGGQPLGALVKVKMDNWKKAKEVSISGISNYMYIAIVIAITTNTFCSTANSKADNFC